MKMHNVFKTHRKIEVDNCISLGDTLPQSSFIEFPTYKLKSTELLWVNKSLVESYSLNSDDPNVSECILANYSYVAKGYCDKKYIFTSDSKPFVADRYGSRHEVCNGGSARCGLNGQFQIKGIGVNPLLADNMKETHTNGKLFTDEAILEAIWGEICHQYLPFGAVRTLAIIKTNISSEFMYSDKKEMKPCALAIREFAVRPAHFERATFFWPKREFMTLRNNDADRVRESVKLLHKSIEKNSVYSQYSAYELLSIMVSRVAEQVAYSRVLGIPHGALTSSNISIDGRFLDFGTMTAVPDFGNYVLSEGVGAVWDDEHLIIHWLDNLAQTVSKYSSNNEKIEKRSIGTLIEKFLYELDRNENIALLRELNVTSINENNIKLARQLKLILKGERRIGLGDFDADTFKHRVTQLARQYGLEVPKVNFFLRDFKYSTFSIKNDRRISDQNFTKQSVSSLINSYVLPKEIVC
ncbi:protein adenylyltransferase SelO family protein [Vibrio diabolicus]|uniref:protein adenylyltransferase SelO family protein n=1 Tax=Vibrio diabolicus TaxID=50719 RepID=UPI00215C7D41|nr:protein adenylyltransferase SelO family protein [Vibrio diabolicus]MCR9306461.1 protein adenylyltransferase SelO family protein [Vibrio diabolicus]